MNLTCGLAEECPALDLQSVVQSLVEVSKGNVKKPAEPAGAKKESRKKEDKEKGKERSGLLGRLKRGKEKERQWNVVHSTLFTNDAALSFLATLRPICSIAQERRRERGKEGERDVREKKERKMARD